MTKEKTFRAFIDRIENGKAVLLVGEHEDIELVVPKELLPPTAVEGAVLYISIRHDEKESERLREAVERMVQELTNRNSADNSS
jgi:hypothetical protein